MCFSSSFYPSPSPLSEDSAELLARARLGAGGEERPGAGATPFEQAPMRIVDMLLAIDAVPANTSASPSAGPSSRCIPSSKQIYFVNSWLNTKLFCVLSFDVWPCS